MSEDNLTWFTYPENNPGKDGYGYYYTFYHNHDENKDFYKCIFWTGKDWFPWRPGGGPKLTVIKYSPETKAPYYTESCKLAGMW